MSNRKGSSNGISLGMVLFIIFLVLKLIGVITWSWWWVTCPLWIGLVLLLGITACVFLMGGTAVGLAALFSKK